LDKFSEEVDYFNRIVENLFIGRQDVYSDANSKNKVNKMDKFTEAIYLGKQTYNKFKTNFSVKK